MNMILFCTAFIFQFVGHRIGDYLLQTDWQAQNKAKVAWERWKHCIVYSLAIAALMLISFNILTVIWVFAMTFFEHYFIDSRKPIVWWKTTLERIVGNKQFDIVKMPFFVLIEIDQTVHYTRCLVISLLIGYALI
jgi:fatty acid desaturase